MYQVLNVSRVTFRLILVIFQIKPNLKVSHPVSMTKKWGKDHHLLSRFPSIQPI